MSTLTVGVGQQFSTIAGAVNAAASGDTINVQAGTYMNDFVTDSTKSLTLNAVGGQVVMNATQQAPNGKAIFTEGGSGITVAISGFTFENATVRDGNGAGIRYEGGTLNVTNSVFSHNQNGILGGADPNGVITIDHSEFNSNGAGDGYTHNIYIGDIGSFSLTNSYVHDANVGHEVKSRAENNTITGNVIADNNSTASYEIDLPNGGNANIANNVVQQGPNSQNPNIIAYGEEGNLHSGTTLSVTGNTIVNDEGRGPALTNATNSTATFTNNSVYGFGANSLVSGPATQSGTNVLSTRPSFTEAVPSTRTTVLTPTVTPVPTPTPTPTPIPTPTPGPDTIVVNASASLAGGVGAHFNLVVDGTTVGNATVNSTTQAYSFNTTLAGGSSAAHDIKVLFDNDAVINGQDRNLFLQSISVDGQTTAATDSHEVYHATGTASSGFGPGDLASNGNMYWQGTAEFILPAAAPVSTPIPTPTPGPDTIVVNASASLAGGVGAHFNLVVDGTTVGNATVNSTTQAYSFNTTLAGGSSAAHDIKVLFDNDAVINGQDRNLFLQSISVDGQTTAATDSHEVYHATGTASSGFGPGDLASNGNMYWQGTAEFILPAAAPVSTPISTPTPGPDTIVVNASASLAGGVGAHFNLVVDGTTVGNATVNSTTQAYSFNTTLAGGSTAAHDIKVLFDNDAVINGQDRNLFLQSISVDGQTTAATDSHEVYHATGTASSGFGPGDLASNGNMYWQGTAEFNLPAVLR